MRCLLSVPNSTPLAALNWDCGMLSMEYRVLYKKILFLHYLVYLDENTLAKQMFCAQKEFNFPGFVSEGRELLRMFDLPNIVDESIAVTKLQWKTMVRKAIHFKFEEQMKEKIQKMTKP